MQVSVVQLEQPLLQSLLGVVLVAVKQSSYEAHLMFSPGGNPANQCIAKRRAVVAEHPDGTGSAGWAAN
ncbi:MAG: hypothetical protein DMG31_17080 [Acidobacteria bacterium]|nr:MAG: hypothetical protein DMG31_17080 [Acidobacteriota bacterium]